MAKIRTTLDYNGVPIPLEVHIERRQTLRAAFGRNKVIVRIPNRLSQVEQKAEYERAKQWVTKTLHGKPQLLGQFEIKEYDGRKISVMGKVFEVRVEKDGVSSCRGILKDQVVYVKVAEEWSARQQHDVMQKTLSKLFGKVFLPKINNEVRNLNQQYFRKDIESIRLKYNKSNWGSCSSKRNINLSTRLLLVPNEVRQYVIIHELAHLLEMNHSSKYWAIVEQACPKYRLYEKWLTEHGPKIDF